MELHDGVDDQQGCITIVTLYVQVVQVGSSIDVWLQVLFLVALPGVDSEILGIEDETSEASEVELCLRLDAESATHVVVAPLHLSGHRLWQITMVSPIQDMEAI